MSFLTKEEIKRLEQKIAAAESLTSAEFKIIVAPHAWFGFKRKAIKLFKKYQLDKTKERNAVLLMILEKDQQILVYGDSGIHDKLQPLQWQVLIDSVVYEFKTNSPATAIGLGINLITSLLKAHFPATESHNNQVSNEIIFEK